MTNPNPWSGRDDEPTAWERDSEAYERFMLAREEQLRKSQASRRQRMELSEAADRRYAHSVGSWLMLLLAAGMVGLLWLMAFYR